MASLCSAGSDCERKGENWGSVDRPVSACSVSPCQPEAGGRPILSDLGMMTEGRGYRSIRGRGGDRRINCERARKIVCEREVRGDMLSLELRENS